MRQQQRKYWPLLVGNLHEARQGIKCQQLHAQKAKQNGQHQARRLPQHAKVNAHADSDEEKAQQQSLKRLNVGFQFAPVFAFRQQHAGQESAKCHRQADQLHQRSNADDEQQRRGGEDFRRSAVGNPAQNRAQQQPAAKNNAADNSYDFYSFKCPAVMG